MKVFISMQVKAKGNEIFVLDCLSGEFPDQECALVGIQVAQQLMRSSFLHSISPGTGLHSQISMAHVAYLFLFFLAKMLLSSIVRFSLLRYLGTMICHSRGTQV